MFRTEGTLLKAAIRGQPLRRSSALKEKYLFDSPVAYSKHLAMKADRGVTIVRQNLHLIADLCE
jgi:hypothetical protein